MLCHQFLHRAVHFDGQISQFCKKKPNSKIIIFGIEWGLAGLYISSPYKVFHRILCLMNLTTSKLWPHPSPKVRDGLLEINSFLSHHRKEVRVSFLKFFFPFLSGEDSVRCNRSNAGCVSRLQPPLRHGRRAPRVPDEHAAGGVWRQAMPQLHCWGCHSGLSLG